MKFYISFLYYQYKNDNHLTLVKLNNKIMTTLIQAIALLFALVIMIFVAKWQVNDDIKKMQKRLDDASKESNNILKRKINE